MKSLKWTHRVRQRPLRDQVPAGRRSLSGTLSRHGRSDSSRRSCAKTEEKTFSWLVASKHSEDGRNAKAHPFISRQPQAATRRQAVCRMVGGLQARGKGI